MTPFKNVNRDSLPARILTWCVLGLLVLLALKMLSWVLGVVVGIVFFLLFTVVPVLLVGWGVMKLWQFFTRPDDSTRHEPSF